MNDILYCGYESQIYAEEGHRAQALARMGLGGEEPKPTPYTLQGNVAAIDISGSLVSGSAGFMSYFGYTGYNDIRNSLVAAVSDSAVGSILLNVDSGGGHVAGVHELAQLIARIDKIKPIVTYTGGTMASAALWLGSGGRKIVASETSMVGSVSILQVHIDRTKQLEQDGIKATVIRSGEDKALANPYEPLTDKAKADLETQAKELHDVFLGHVASQRGLNAAAAQEKFGTGKVFIGKQAISAGLVDQIGGYEAAYSMAAKLAEKLVKKQAASNSMNVRAQTLATQPVASALGDNPGNIEPQAGTQMQDDLSPEALAALAGVDLGAAEGTAPVASAPVAPAAADEALTAALATAEAALAAAQASLATTQASLATAQAEAEAAKAEAEALKAQIAADKPQFDAALEIARASVRTMGIHFDVKAEAVAAMSASEVLENHKTLAEKFRAKFKVKAGGVAAASVDPQPAQTKPALVDPLFAARVNRHQ